MTISKLSPFVAWFVLLAIGCHSKQVSQSPSARLLDGKFVTSRVGPAGGTIIFNGAVELLVPAGALNNDADITISLTEDIAPSDLAVTTLSAIYQFQPEGLSFNIPATVSFQNVSASDGTVYWTLPATTDQYEEIGGVASTDGAVLAATISHFSRGFVARRKTVAVCDPAACPGRRCENNACSQYASCKELYANRPAEKTGVYSIKPASVAQPLYAYCAMDVDGGGWTLLMKLDGNQNTFLYDNAIWADTTRLNVNSLDLSKTEAKLDGFDSIPFSEVRLGMDDNGTVHWIVLQVANSGTCTPQCGSLQAVFSSGSYVPTQVGQAQWSTLVNQPVLQANCNKEGFNVLTEAPEIHGARIGILTNQEMDCGTSDSSIGFGTHGVLQCYSPTPSPVTCVGNVASAGCSPLVPISQDLNLPTFGYVMVR